MSGSTQGFQNWIVIIYDNSIIIYDNYLLESVMKRRKIASVDQDTGEVLDGVVVYCGVKQNPYSTGWVMNSQEALELLATDKDLKGETYRVLLLLLSRLDFENWIQVTQNEISEKLEMKKLNRHLQKYSNAYPNYL